MLKHGAPHLKRRHFITLLGSAAAAWPLAARAQQPAMPVIGFLDNRSPEAVASRLRAFRQGLRETGYIEAENVAIVFRGAENELDRLPELAADLVRRQVAVIVPVAASSIFAAKASIGSGQGRSRVHRLRQGQSRQAQHGVGWYRKRHTSGGRAVQDH